MELEWKWTLQTVKCRVNNLLRYCCTDANHEQTELWSGYHDVSKSIKVSRCLASSVDLLVFACRSSSLCDKTLNINHQRNPNLLGSFHRSSQRIPLFPLPKVCCMIQLSGVDHNE
ncbi:unnamed protein product [Heterobilharzia americana]|nr:unnamed protein product [Heterobilharzia americana]